MKGGPLGEVELDSKDTDEPDNPIGQMLIGMVKAMGSMEMTFKVDPTGEMSDVKISEAAVKKFKMPAIGGLGNDMVGPDSLKGIVQGSVIVPLPKDAVGKGKSWSQKTDQKTGMGQVETDTQYTYDSVIEKGGKKLDKILVKPDVKIKPTENAKIQIKLKSNSGKGAVLFDNEACRIVEARSEANMQMEMEAGGMTIDADMKTNTTLRIGAPGQTGEKKTPSSDKK